MSARAACTIALLVGSILALPSPARADDAPFGSKGQWVVSGTTAIGVTNTATSSSDVHSFSAAFSPSIDVFVANRFSLGLDLQAEYDLVRATVEISERTTAVVITPGARAGYDLPLSDRVSIWFRGTAGLSWRHVELTQLSSLGGTAYREDLFAHSEFAPLIAADAHLLFRPASGWFVGIGPYVSYAFGRTISYDANDAALIGARGSLGGDALIGAYFGGPHAAQPDVEPMERAYAAQKNALFGQKGDVVISSEIGGDLNATVLRTGGLVESASVAPALDYFVLPHLSIGVAIPFSYAYARGTDTYDTVLSAPDPSVTLTRKTVDIGITARVGTGFAIADRWSIEARAGLTSRQSLVQETYAPADQTGYGDRTSIVWAFTVGADAHLLFHPVNRVFLGLGPTIARDVAYDSTLHGPTGGPIYALQLDPEQTRIGVSFTVGGWL